MTVNHKTELNDKERLHDDLSEIEVKSSNLDLNMLKLQNQAKEAEEKLRRALLVQNASVVEKIVQPIEIKTEEIKKVNNKQENVNMSAVIVGKKERSLELGVLGSGQAGSRLAEAFFALGYDAVAINTAIQDLKHIKIPDSNKLLLEYGVGGAAKDRAIGNDAAENFKGEILQLLNDKLANSQINVFCVSLGGGSGSGSINVMIDALTQIGKPIVVIGILPMSSEDSATKSNSLQALSELAEFVQNKKVSSAIIVDNSKLESIYSNVSQMNFFNIANKVIVEPIDLFNCLSSQPSSNKPLDSSEWLKLLLDGNGLSCYGELTVSNYQEDTAVAEAVMGSLSNNLLASGFDLKSAKYVGAIFTANKEVWNKIPSSSINYAMSMVGDLCNSPNGIFKGVYEVESKEDAVKVYTFFSGLGLPEARIDQLKKETFKLNEQAKVKDDNRVMNMKIDLGKEQNISAADQVKAKIAAKGSGSSRVMNKIITDRRK